MIEHSDDVWHGYAIHHHLAFHAAVTKMHVLISPCLPYATGEGVSQDKKTNVFSDSDIQNMCFRWWQSWDVEDVGSLLLQHFGSYEAPCK